MAGLQRSQYTRIIITSEIELISGQNVFQNKHHVRKDKSVHLVGSPTLPITRLANICLCLILRAANISSRLFGLLVPRFRKWCEVYV